MEVWKDIPGFPDYKASNLGRIQSNKKKTPKILKQSKGDKTQEYLRVTLYINGKRIDKPVHQLVLLAFKGPRPEGYESCHLNGIPSDNKEENLKWGTKEENASHKILHGTRIIGETCHLSIMTEERVNNLRYLGSLGVYEQTELAKMFDISSITAGRILRRETWIHIEDIHPPYKRKKKNHNGCNNPIQQAVSAEIKELVLNIFRTEKLSYLRIGAKVGLHETTVGKIIREERNNGI